MMDGKQIKKYAGGVAVILLATFPLLLWIFAEPLDTRFLSSTATLTSFGQVAGLIGMALFAISLILGARFGFVSKFFGGLDREQGINNLTGIMGFFLLLLHPLFLATKYISISLGSAALFLLPGKDATVNLGIYALLALIVFALIMISARSKYPSIRGTYRFLGVVFMVGGLHAFLIPSDIANVPLLRWYMTGLTVVALSVYLYKGSVGSFLAGKFTYKTPRVVPQESNIREM